MLVYAPADGLFVPEIPQNPTREQIGHAREILLAHKFIDFILDPRVAAEMTEYICYLCPNEVSYQYLSAEIRTNPILFPPPEVVEKLEMIADLGEANAKYAKLWNEIEAEK